MKGHILHFIVLVLILGMGVGTFLLAQGSRPLQLFIGVITSAAYMTWGMIHNAMLGDLHRKVVIEYLCIGAIAIVLLFIALGY